MTKKHRKTKTDQDEQQFLARYDASQFPHPSVAVDVALITAQNSKLQALLIKRNEYPYRGKWSLPGGFVEMRESLDEAAGRVLDTKIGIADIFLEQLYTFGDPKRDPRTRVISVTYYALVNAAKLEPLATGAPDKQLAALGVPWKGETGGPVHAFGKRDKQLTLAFDHAEMLGVVVKRLRGKLNYAPIGFELLPQRFTLRQLQNIHEAILDQRLNKDSFRRRTIATGFVVPTGKYEAGVGHRPAELYRFKRKS